MMENLVALGETPIPTILVIAGLLFLLLNFVEGAFNLKVSADKRKGIGTAGVLILSVGIVLYVLPLLFNGVEATDNPGPETEQEEEVAPKLTTNTGPPPAPAPAEPNSEGLVAYYPFDNDSDDHSTYAHHAVTRGNTAFVTGQQAAAATFDGSSGWMTVNSGLNFRTAFSFSFLISTDDTSATLFQKGEHCPNANRPEFRGTAYEIAIGGRYVGNYETEGAGYLNAIAMHRGGNYDTLRVWSTSAQQVDLTGTYHHVAIVFDRNRFRYYIDGKAIDVDNFVVSGRQGNVVTELPTAFSEIHETSSPFKIGATERYCNESNSQEIIPGFSGSLDELRIYETALSDEEVGDLAAYYGVAQ